MLKRCGILFKASSAVKAVGFQAPPKSLSRIKVEVADDLLRDFKPRASDAPELLEPFVTPNKPFEKSKAASSVQLFFSSFLVGGAAVAGIFFLLSDAVAQEHERECFYADGIQESNTRHAAVLENFVAPSSYQYLLEKMAQGESQNDIESNVGKDNENVLHNEILFRGKLWWNRQLSLIDEALSKVVAQRQLRLEENSIRCALQVRGYELIRLEKGIETIKKERKE